LDLEKEKQRKTKGKQRKARECKEKVGSKASRG